jgi:predicted metal-dependent peptidase
MNLENLRQQINAYYQAMGLPPLPMDFFQLLKQDMIEQLSNKLEEEIRLNEIGIKILKSIKTDLFMMYKFFGLALSHYQESTSHALFYQITDKIATNGKYLYFSPLWLIRQFKKGSHVIKRTYLHLLFHAVFKHMFQGRLEINKDHWNLATDIAVEFLIDDLHDHGVQNQHENERKEVYEAFYKQFPVLHAKAVYEALNKPAFARLCKNKRKIFEVDDHHLWYVVNKPSQPPKQSQGNPKESTDGSSQVKLSSTLTQMLEDLQRTNPILMDESSISEDLNEIANRLEIDLDSFHKSKGDQASNMKRLIHVQNRKRYDYRDFLRKFMTYREMTKESLDEFDYIYYTLGLKNYGNLPLIEPLEYSLAKVIETFVIAIDTSGSTFSSVVSVFLEETFQILKQADLGYRRVQIYLIQCDAAIAEEKVFTTFSEVEGYLKNFELKGGGGTDFRPVFDRVSELMDSGKLNHLKGLIYLTDGMGTYPEKRTPYETAFVFYEGDQYNDKDVPPWASKLIIHKEEIK